METVTRGARIRRRMEYLGETPTSIARRAGIDRGTVNRALEDHPGVKTVSYQAIENVLTEIEHENGVDLPDIEPAQLTSSDAGQVELNVVIEGGITVRATVKGPVTNVDALKATITEMARESIELARADEEQQRRQIDE